MKLDPERVSLLGDQRNEGVENDVQTMYQRTQFGPPLHIQSRNEPGKGFGESQNLYHEIESGGSVFALVSASNRRAKP